VNIIHLENWINQKKKPEISARIDIEAEAALCSICGERMRVQKTITRKIVTLRHNSFNTHERVLECPMKCKYPNESYVTSRASSSIGLAPIGSNYGYDLEVYVGMERFVRHRQREEIQSALKEEYSISVSSGEISILSARFLSHIEELHKIKSDSIREVLSKDGGYPLHIDCTTEGGKGTLLVIFTGWQKWVLGSWKIPTESAVAITPHITEICQIFGEPLAIVRDLGQPIARAIEDAADIMLCRPKILACHFHFLRDVGKGLLGDDYEHLRMLIRKLSVRENIRVVIRELRKKCDADDLNFLHSWFDNWLKTGEYPSLPGGSWGMSLVIALGLWVLDYSSDSQNLGFPFDCQYHNLYKRCQTAGKAIEFFLAEIRLDRHVDKALERLNRAFSPLVNNKDVHKTVHDLEIRVELFNKLRNIFRVEYKSFNHDSPNNINSKLTGIPIANNSYSAIFDPFEEYMQNQIRIFEEKLKRQYEANHTGRDLKHAIKIILTHLEKHGEFLWGHSLVVKTESSWEIRLVDRTNNILENFFHEMKHGERRRSGHKVLTRDFENIPAAASLAMNLRDPEYVKIICGSLDKLPECFSKIDQSHRNILLNTPELEKMKTIFNDWALNSCTDKAFVRRDSVISWILAASKSKPISELKEETKNNILTPFEDMEQFLLKCAT